MISGWSLVLKSPLLWDLHFSTLALVWNKHALKSCYEWALFQNRGLPLTFRTAFLSGPCDYSLSTNSSSYKIAKIMDSMSFSSHTVKSVMQVKLRFCIQICRKFEAQTGSNLLGFRFSFLPVLLGSHMFSHMPHEYGKAEPKIKVVVSVPFIFCQN